MEKLYSETFDDITVKAMINKRHNYVQVDVTVPLPQGGTRTTGFPIKLGDIHV